MDWPAVVGSAVGVIVAAGVIVGGVRGWSSYTSRSALRDQAVKCVLEWFTGSSPEHPDRESLPDIVTHIGRDVAEVRRVTQANTAELAELRATMSTVVIPVQNRRSTDKGGRRLEDTDPPGAARNLE